MRIGSLAVLVLFTITLAGCGDSGPRSPAPGELDRYLDDNPEAAKRGGQQEPAGLNGPTEVPG